MNLGDQKQVNLGGLILEQNLNTDAAPEGFRPFQKRSSTLEVLGANFALASIDTTTRLIGRRMARAGDRDDNMLSPEELNERFPRMEKPFTQPTSETVAETLAETQNRRNQLKGIIERGDPDSVIQNYGGFVMGMAAHLIDPVGLALGGVVGRGLGFVAAKAAAYGGGAIANTIGRIQQAKLARAVVENAAGAAVEEAAIAIPLIQEELQDVDTMEQLSMSIAASAAFPLVLAGGSRVTRGGLGYLGYGRRATDKMTNAVHLAEGQMANGKRIELESYINAEKKSEIPQLRQQLDEATARGDEAQVRELEEVIREAEDAPTPNRAEEAQVANSPETDIGFNKEDFDTFNRNLQEPLELELDPLIRTSLDDIETRVAELEASGQLDPETRKIIDEARSEFTLNEKNEEMAKAATFCVRAN